MQVKIQQWGNSAAIRLPSAVLKQMSLVSGDVLVLDVDAATESLILKLAKAKPHYRLADLMAQCDLTAPEPADLAAWNAMQPVGREA
ncbi:PbsX family transcriptional regulator (plasmid) [Pseudomonas frederiksbergensis]|uniref:PbsX family transcriptional regulator n=1 Tax=Pseudomonas frederiksbergensis TaxID=104087 RepID=A0A1J0EUJ6_9PSED|nr:AbrB/MazE/SpoVT family DNA-binding domain-containing protein [Pseudomonas frederiksbergensis]APC19504.1 PbsX family transcriptional regulator [Pseudomonas frederiksbergensis]